MNRFQPILILLYISSAICGDLPGNIEHDRLGIIVQETKLLIRNNSGEDIDSIDTSPFEIKDYCVDTDLSHVFLILGISDSLRGERLAIFSRLSASANRLWIDDNRGHNPWKIICCDVDGDNRYEVCVGVWKKARFHPVFDNRLFVYNWDGVEIFPKWLGSRLSSPFVDFDFYDIDDDGISELIALELQRDRLKRVMTYKWTGFGFEGFRVIANDLEEGIKSLDDIQWRR